MKLAILAASLYSVSWATFSIVAVDPQTRQVGSAGATCLDSSSATPWGALVISDVIPGRGAIHTQAAYLATNKQRAHDRMVAGDSPQEIIAYMQRNDAGAGGGDPTVRQYGVVDLYQGSARSAAFTGVNCMNHKSHATGSNYSIQGNILSYLNDTAQGRRVIDSMQARFTRTTGTLADKLMAAMQGAKWRGADQRCYSRQASTLSAFLRVARPNDPANQLYLDLRIPKRPLNGDPIDSLQKLYDAWKRTVPLAGAKPGGGLRISRRPGFLRLEAAWIAAVPSLEVVVAKPSGESVFARALASEAGAVNVPRRFDPGLYLVRLRSGPGAAWHRVLIF